MMRARRRLQSPILDFSLWVLWKAERCETPDWWRELSAKPGKEDARKLSQGGEGILQTPTAVVGTGFKGGYSPGFPCTTIPLQKRFMPPANSIFVCRDIQEIPREKVVAYARALQHWAEQNIPPATGEPHLLVRSVLELREEVRW